jgi:hypothetical protein
VGRAISCSRSKPDVTLTIALDLLLTRIVLAPAGKMVHVILDNYAAHKHPKVRAWLDRHERVAVGRAERAS